MAWLKWLYRHHLVHAGILLGAFSGFPAEAQSPERQTFQLGTATTDELSHAVGVTLAALVKLKLLPTADIDINARNTDGPLDNARLLQESELEFAILTSLKSLESLKAPGASIETDNDLRVLTNLWHEAYHFVVKKPLVSDGDFSEFLKLEDIKIALGKRGSDEFANSKALFDAFDVDVDKTFRVEDLSGSEAASAFLDGNLDAFVLTAEASDAELLSFLADAGDTAVLVNVSEDDVDEANGRGRRGWSSAEIAPGSYAGQKGAQRSFAVNYLLGAAASVNDEAAYQITKTIYDNLPVLQGMHRATDNVSLQYALAEIVLPVHPGAVRYYGEIGVQLPVLEPIRISNLAETDFLARFSTTEEARLRVTENNISIMGGEGGQTVDRFTSELAGSLQTGAVRVLGMTSPDPANNIAQILYGRGVDSAVVPVDILNYAVEEGIYTDLQSKLVYATELFPEEFHLVTTTDIGSTEDLLNKPVNLGVKGSSSEFTASLLFDDLNLPVQPTYHEPRKALKLLQQGDLAAVVLIAGKPTPLLQEIGLTDGLKLLAVPALKDPAYRTATITSSDYPDLLAAGETVETFGVRNALMTYNWRVDNPRYATLTAFVAAFFDKLSRLNDEPAELHPKWKDINPFAELDGWRRFPGAEDWLSTGEATVGSNAAN